MSAVGRAEIETYLAERGVLDARQDPSNADAAYQRNRIRNELLPLIDDIVGRGGIGKTSLALSVLHEMKETDRYEILRPEDTEVRVKGQIISQGVHQDGRVKGGDFLLWLDRVATYTARQFTRNDHCITLFEVL